MRLKLKIVYLFGCHREMCRLFSCVPIFREVFLLKGVNKICLCDSIKNRIVTCEKWVY